jgi:hypothetical protein
MFQRRHYEKIAETLGAMDGLDCATCEALSRMFNKDNPNFDRIRFLAACGYPEWAIKGVSG